MPSAPLVLPLFTRCCQNFYLTCHNLECKTFTQVFSNLCRRYSRTLATTASPPKRSSESLSSRVHAAVHRGGMDIHLAVKSVHLLQSFDLIRHFFRFSVSSKSLLLSFSPELTPVSRSPKIQTDRKTTMTPLPSQVSTSLPISTNPLTIDQLSIP